MGYTAPMTNTDNAAGDGNITHVTDQTFADFVSKDIVIIDFWADWCTPCHAVAPIYKELSEEFAGKVRFGKLNTDENPMVSNQYGIMSIPTFIVFKDGQAVAQDMGAMPKGRFVKLLNDVLESE